MKKKFISLLCIILAITMSGCANSSFDDVINTGEKNAYEIAQAAAYGEKITGAQGAVLLTQAELNNQELEQELQDIKNLALDKFTFVTTQTIGEMVSSTTISYSKSDKYISVALFTQNAPLYEYNEQTNSFSDTLLSYTHYGEWVDKDYIDSRGYLLETEYSYDDTTKYQPKQEREQKTKKQYKELEKNLTQAQEKFNKKLENSGLEHLSGYLMQTQQMLATLVPVVELGNVSNMGMTIEIRSKGENHLYIKYSESTYGISYEAVCENGFFTYIKTSTPNVEDLPSMPTGGPYNGTMTSEIRFYPNQCEISYPDLSTYKKLA